MAGYVVTAPYVTLLVTDANGAPVIRGFYKGSPVPAGVDEGSLLHHLDCGMVAEAAEAPAEEPVVEEPKPATKTAKPAAK
jgi:hypothetical protein